MSESYRSPDGRNHTLWNDIFEAMDAVLPAYGSQTAERREQRGWMFRGQSDSTWKLAPTLYREPLTPTVLEDRHGQAQSFIAALRSNAERLGLSNAADDEMQAVAQH